MCPRTCGKSQINPLLWISYLETHLGTFFKSEELCLTFPCEQKYFGHRIDESRADLVTPILLEFRDIMFKTFLNCDVLA